MSRRPTGRAGGAFGMAVGTACSRATGILRTLALASALGVSAVSDAYNTANTAPTMIFTLVAGGALSAAVVPLLVKAGPQRQEVASVLLGATLLVGVVTSAVVAVVAPAVFRILTVGARGRPDYEPYVELGASWLRMFSPQIGLYALSVLAVAIMSARRRFQLGAAAPVATNALTVAAAMAFVLTASGRPVGVADVSTGGRLLLGWGTTVAVGTMTVIQLLGAWRCEPGMRLRFELRHPAVLALVRMGGWLFLYVAVNQIGLAVIISVASSVVGGVTAYQWGFMVMQLPYAVVAVSLISTAVPHLAGSTDVAARRDSILAAAQDTFIWMVPAAVGLAALAQPVATAMVGPRSATLVAAAVAGFALSLVPFSLFQLITRTRYALGDARTPALCNIVVNAFNVAAAALFFAVGSNPAVRVAGLALSHAVSYALGCALLWPGVLRRHEISLRRLLVEQRRILVAAAPLVGLAALWGPLSASSSRAGAAAAVVALSSIGVVVYALAARALGVELPRLGVRASAPER